MKITGVSKLGERVRPFINTIVPTPTYKTLSETLAETNIQPPSAFSLAIRDFVGKVMEKFNGCFVSWR